VRTPEQDERLTAYENLLRSWASRLNLFSPADLARLHSRHIEDSLQVLPLLDGLVGPCVDVGSGAGLPGVPLAICAPHLRWRLLEPRTRRAAFLEEVIRTLELDAEVVMATAEAAAKDPALAAGHGLATARALAPPLEAFRMIGPLVREGGLGVVFLGERAEVPEGAEGRPGGLAIMKKTSAPS
jgi:16S rRNA (guanine527-N7)-methyltransferase